jgi:hypothetical protein
MGRRPVALAALGLLLITGTAGAHIFGPELESGKAEIGLGHIWFHRDMALSEPKEFEWDDNTLFIRYGAFDWLTVFGEGAYWDRSDNDRFPGRDYTTYRVGVGITYRVAEMNHWGIGGAFYYGRSFWFDRAATRYHKEVTSSVIAISIHRTFTLGGQSITLWGGTGLLRDEYVEFPWGGHAETRWDSEHDLSGMLGLRVSVLRHFVLSSYVAYSGYFQPRIMVGYGS